MTKKPKYLNNVRANEFDQWVGRLQTLKAAELGRGKSILDIGCGVGQFTPMFLKRFERVVGIDASEKFLKVARKNNNKIEYISGFGESFKLDEKFDTISMNMLLEHVDDPVALLKNCKRHLSKGGIILAQVPNANSVTRRIGVLMGVIDSINHISEKERDYFGHQRTYTLATLLADCRKAGLKVVAKGGLLFKPLPNEILGKICKERGQEWADKFIEALVAFGSTRPEDCANLFVACE
jgi:2-polyprenyl-3-methyl-5-hydroxy-6-metoxy-1,4-benzoquinol methylase